MRRLRYLNKAKKAAVLAITQIASLAANNAELVEGSSYRDRVGLRGFRLLRGRVLRRVRFEDREYAATTRKIAKPIATMTA